MKCLKKSISFVTILLVVCLLSGCSLINVNTERDNQQVIATIGSEDVLKSQFNNYIAMMDMSYQMYGSALPTGSSLKTLKENIYDSLIDTLVYEYKAKEDGLTVDESEIEESADSTITYLQSALGEDEYESILSDYNSDSDSFKTWYISYLTAQDYQSQVTDAYEEEINKDPQATLDEVVGTIGDEDVTRGTYDYYLISDYMQGIITSTTATDEEAMNEQIFEEIELDRANVVYCEENDIEITDKMITEAQKTLQSTLDTAIGDDSSTFDSLLENYYLTDKLYKEYQKEAAKAQAAKDAISEKLIDEQEVTDKEIETYYEDNLPTLHEEKVSAMHILTSDKSLAKEIYNEAKDVTSKEDFQKIIDSYEDNEEITEATDLGSFDYATMVEPFSEAAFAADKGTVVGPVETDYGYHVIYVYDKTQGNDKTVDELKDSITKTLKNEKGQDAYSTLEEELGKKYKISVGTISTPLEEYVQQLRTDYDVKEYKSKAGI